MEDNDISIELTAEAIRHMLDTGEALEYLETALDEAQGPVFSGEKETVIIRITVKKDKA